MDDGLTDIDAPEPIVPPAQDAWLNQFIVYGVVPPEEWDVRVEDCPASMTVFEIVIAPATCIALTP